MLRFRSAISYCDFVVRFRRRRGWARSARPLTGPSPAPRTNSQASDSRESTHDVTSILADLHLGYHVLGRLLRAELEAADVSMSEALVLRLLVSSVRATMSDLVVSTGLPATTLTSLVMRLEERGYVRRQRLEGDRRYVVVRPRRVGTAIGRMVASAMSDIEARLLSHAAAGDRRGLAEIARALDLVERPELPSRLD